MKVLLTGAGGQVGLAVQASAPASTLVLPLTRTQLDISSRADVDAAVREFEPALIINAAAYTAVDKAESEPDLAFSVNEAGPRNLAMAAQAIPGCRLIHISTDYVFDGTAARAYRPGDAENPVSVYGRSKFAGEQAVMALLGARVTILRTAWVYAPRGRNFLLTMLRLMRERHAVRVVSDQQGSPTSARSIAAAIWAIAARPEVSGLLHWTDGGAASWYEFAAAIALEAQAAGLTDQKSEVTPITTAEYPTAARRPANSVLDTTDAVAQLGLAPPSWREELHDTIRQLQ